jgi:hypothetical protein
MKKLIAGFPIVAAALAFGLASAHAFTFEDNGAGTSGGSTLVDPDQQVKSVGAGTTNGQGGLRFNVGPASGFGTNLSGPPPAWSRNPLFLDKGSQDDH